MMLRTGLFIILLLSWIPTAHAAPTAKLLKHNGEIEAKIQGLELNSPEFRKDLQSGLTKVIAVQATLVENQQPLFSRVYRLGIRFDLWSENFHCELTSPSGIMVDEFKTVDQVIARIRDFNLPDVAATTKLRPQTPYRLLIKVLVNPVHAEKAEKIKRWVAENNVAPPSDPSTGTTGAASLTGRARANTWMNTLFEGYLKEGSEGAESVIKFESEEFQL